MAVPARVLTTRERKENILLRSSRTEGQVTIAERNDRLAQNQFRRRAILLCTMIAVLIAFPIAQREMIVRSSYELVSIKSQMNNLQKENEFLKIELAGLNSPDRIQAAATTQLGMVVPERVHYVQANPNYQENTGVAQLP